jgi:hypothetical protein
LFAITQSTYKDELCGKKNHHGMMHILSSPSLNPKFTHCCKDNNLHLLGSKE